MSTSCSLFTVSSDRGQPRFLLNHKSSAAPVLLFLRCASRTNKRIVACLWLWAATYLVQLFPCGFVSHSVFPLVYFYETAVRQGFTALSVCFCHKLRSVCTVQLLQYCRGRSRRLCGGSLDPPASCGRTGGLPASGRPATGPALLV